MSTAAPRLFGFRGFRDAITIVFFLIVLVQSSIAISAAQPADKIVKVRISSEIARPNVELVRLALEEALAVDARLLIIELNTPGGEVGSVTEILGLFDNSKIPVCVFVSPLGAEAWSGGTYILMASHVAAMASGTTIGSAQPVLSTGETINASKYVNALVGLMKNHARLHGRNETLAELFVTKNVNLGPEEALRYHIIDFTADDIPQLLSRLERYTLLLTATEEGTSVWRLVPTESAQRYTSVVRFNFDGVARAEIIEYKAGLRIVFFNVLSNPLVSATLFLVGIYTLLTGLKTPGFGLELAGTIAIFLALIGFGIIGMSLAAALLFILGVTLTLIELKTHIGIFAIAGISCIVIGAFLVFPVPGWELLAYRAIETMRIIFTTIAVAISSFFAIVVYKAAQARRSRIKAGSEALLGKFALASTKLSPNGIVKYEGQTWRAETTGGEIEDGEWVEIVGRRGLTLIVSRRSK
jgi:membrane-bound serine protease (ClpP class)